jgi:chemotaxis signal transduction protein
MRCARRRISRRRSTRQYITGLGTVEDRMLILVDIENFMSGADMALMDAAAH